MYGLATTTYFTSAGSLVRDIAQSGIYQGFDLLGKSVPVTASGEILKLNITPNTALGELAGVVVIGIVVYKGIKHLRKHLS